MLNQILWSGLIVLAVAVSFGHYYKNNARKRNYSLVFLAISLVGIGLFMVRLEPQEPVAQENPSLDHVEAYQAVKTGKLVASVGLLEQPQIITFDDGSWVEMGIIVADHPLGRESTEMPVAKQDQGSATAYLQISSKDSTIGTFNLSTTYQYGDSRLDITGAEGWTDFSYPYYRVTDVYNRAVIGDIDHTKATITGKYDYEMKSYRDGYVGLDQAILQMRLWCDEAGVSGTIASIMKNT